MRTVPARTAGHHSAAAFGSASSRCAGAATAIPLPGSPLRSAIFQRRPRAGRIGRGQHHPPSVQWQRQPPDAALHGARIVAQHHQGRPAVTGHPHQVGVETGFLQDAVVHRECRAAAPEHRIGQHLQLLRHSPEQRNGYRVQWRRLPRPAARRSRTGTPMQLSPAGRLRPEPRGAPERSQHHRSREDQLAGEVTPPPPPPAASERAIRSARTTPPPHLQVGHEPPVGMHHQPLIQRPTHQRRLYSLHADTPLPITCAPGPANWRTGELRDGMLHR